MRERIAVVVTASDPVSQSGVEAQLRGRPRCLVVGHLDIDRAEVAVVVVDVIDEAACCTIRGLQRDGIPRVVVVAPPPDDAGLMQAIEAGASGFVRRQDATPEALERAIELAERGDGAMPGDLLGRLLERIGELQRNVLAPAGLTPSGLSSREIEVLRLVSEGMDTSQIAGELHYSERTVKNVLHDVTTRFNLRNRSHAVAYAVRNGLI